MNRRPTLDQRITDWLRAEAPDRAPERILAVTLDRVALVGQERGLTPWRYRDWRGTSRAVLIAATVALLVVLGAAAVFVGTQPRTEETPLPPAPAPAVRVAGQGPAVEWTRLEVIPPVDARTDASTTRVAWVHDRFVVVDEDSQTVATSPDGSSWSTLAIDDPDWDYFRVLAVPGNVAIWEDEIVSWTPQVPGSGVRIRRPPDDTFAKADVEGSVDAVGIGPAGIVFSSHIEFDQGAFIESVLGPTWFSGSVESWSLQDGVLSLTALGGRTASITLADHGVDEAEFAGRGQGWHSVDGKGWTPIPDWPGTVTSIVGTAEGFIALGDPGTGLRMFHSPDGLEWQRLAVATGGFAEQMINPVMLPWREGALETDGTFIFQTWTATGKRVLPLTADVRSREHPMLDAAGIGAGPLGIVGIDAAVNEILFSADGIEWSIDAMPGDMANADPGIRTAHDTNVAVGSGAVVVLLWEGGPDGDVRPSLWVGTIAP